MKTARKPVIKSNRLQLRTTERENELLASAAAATDKTVSAFVVESAVIAAEHVLAERSIFTLNEDDWKRFVTALDSPDVELPRLRKLLNSPSVLEAE